MSNATQPDLGWEVLAQPTGEVLTAEARSPGLHLGLLGVPPGFDAADAEGWLYDVAGVSHEASATRPVSRPIPPILDHAVTGLLFSHAELWDQPGCPSPCSFAFVEGRGEVGFGWVGDAKVSVWVDGRLRETGFVTLHDGRGKLGRAWSVPAHHNVQVRISWTSFDPTEGGAEVEASWTADNGSAPGYHGVPEHVAVMEEEAAPAPIQSEPAPAATVTTAAPAPAPAATEAPAATVAPAAPAATVATEAPAATGAPVPAPVAVPERDAGTGAETDAHAHYEVASEQAAAEASLVAESDIDAGTVAEADSGDAVLTQPQPARGFGAWLRRTFGWLGRDPAAEAADEDAVWRQAAGLTLGDATQEDAVAGAAAEVPLLEAPEPHVVVPDALGVPADASAATAGYEERPADRYASAAPEAGEELIPPTPEAEVEFVEASSLQARIQDMRLTLDDTLRGETTEHEELIPPTPEEYEELIPPTPEGEAQGIGEGAETAAFASARDELVVPPTPEPLELTEQATGWHPDDDPRGIDLSRVARRPSFASLDDLTHPRDDLDLRFDEIAIEPPLPAEPIDPTPVELAAPPEEEVAPPALAAEPSASPARDGMQAVAERLARIQAALPASAPEEDPGAPHAATESLPPEWEAVSPQRPAWPSAEELARGGRATDVIRRVWPWVAIVAVLFAGGWLVGSIQDDGRPRDAAHRGALGQALHAVGLGGPRFLVQVSSRPPGAWITVDGEPLSLRTPAAIEVTPGDHTIGLSFSEFGSATYPVRGRKGDRVALDPTLWGSLEVMAPEDFGVIAVSVDGVARGAAPMSVDSLAPGVHEVRFSAAGMEPWGQTVEIRVGESHEVLARAVQSPSSGVLQVQATFTDETGTQPLRGGQVWIDGELRGTTPLILDLPRGPHSIRLVYKGQEAPIQVIDLPGGNQRFAVFELGLDTEVPRLTVEVPARIPRDRPTVVSATVLGISAAEVREMWLHVRMPEGAWRRYAMTLLKAPAGAAGVATFPTAAFDPQGRARYYLSAQSRQGDETYTEIRSIALEPAAK